MRVDSLDIEQAQWNSAIITFRCMRRYDGHQALHALSGQAATILEVGVLLFERLVGMMKEYDRARSAP
jgi:hypothetical protein